MIKDKNIIVTGGAGFIGSHLVERLLENGNFVIIIDNFNKYYDGKEENLKAITSSYKPSEDYISILGDLTKKETLKNLKYDIDIIFHLAAQAGVRYSIENASDVAHNNITSAINVYEYAFYNEVKKVVYASSSSVYGNPIYTPLDEEHPKNPISPYAVSKLSGELYADYYFREYSLPVTSLRFYTVYGPRGRPDMAIRKFFNYMLEGKEITIYGDGTQKRDFTYVSDILNGLILSAENSASNGEVFNLGCSNPIVVNELVEKMYAIANKPKKIRYAEKQKGDVDITYSDTRKANRILKYYPQIGIDEGLKKTFEWQVNYNNF